MSSTKEFRIQNGVDITGDVVVGGQIVIQSDGTILLPSSDTLASMITQATSNQVDALQLQIDTILGSSPEHLNTLQEIVALFQSADGDLGTLINQNSTAISSFQTELDLKATPSDLTALTTTVDAFKASVSGVPSTTTTIVPETTTVTNTVTVPEKSVIYATSVNEIAPDTFDGTRPLYAIDALTGNTLYTMTHPSNLQGSLGEYRTENDSYIIISSVNRNPVNVHGGEVYVYTKNSDGLPEGTPLTITSPAPASINPDEYFGSALLLSGDYLFVGEKQYTAEAPSYQPLDTDQSNPIFTMAGRVSVYQVSTGFQFVKSYNMSDGTGDTSGGAYLLGQHIVGSGNYVMFNIPYHEELPYPQHGINTGQIWVVDTNNINDAHTILGGPQGDVTSNDTHFFITTAGTVSVYESNTLSLVSQIQPPIFPSSGHQNSVGNDYLAVLALGQDSVYVYNVPDLSMVGVVTKPVDGQEFANVAVAGSTLAVSSYHDEYIKLYDIPTSLTTPTHTVNAPQTARYFASRMSGYTVEGSQSTTTETITINTTTTTIVPIETLETTTTNVVGAINDLHAGISSLSGGTCIDYNASTGVISVDEADAAANLHVATSGDATTLEGQTVSHYRQDVYDIHGNIIN